MGGSGVFIHIVVIVIVMLAGYGLLLLEYVVKPV